MHKTHLSHGSTIELSGWLRLAHGCGEERAGLELLQTHGAGVGAEEQDKGHEGDVWDELAGLPHQLSFVLQALRLGERRPRGIRWLQSNRGNLSNLL